MSDELPIPRKESGVFWIEVDKIKPNPMQPRKEFDEKKLGGLAESIRQYGVLQPLIVTRKEYEVPTGRVVEYELIAGERRLEASKISRPSPSAGHYPRRAAGTGEIGVGPY